jgi:hypothetical protein
MQFRFQKKSKRASLFIESLESRVTPATISFSQANYAVTENAGLATISVLRTGDTSNTEIVDYSTANGSAAAGTRYTPASGTLTFGAGETQKSFSIAVVNSPFVNYNQTVQLRLTNPGDGTTLGVSNALLTIVDTQGTVDSSFFQAPDRIWPAGLGVNSLKYLPNGNLAQLLWVNQGDGTWDLIYFQRNDVGNWVPETIDSHPDDMRLFSGSDLQQFQGMAADAQLLIDSNGKPHVLEFEAIQQGVGNGASLNVFSRSSEGWTAQRVTLPTINGNFNFYTTMVADIGNDNSLHVAFIDITSGQFQGPAVLWYGTNKTGSWAFEKVSDLQSQMPLFYETGWRPLSLAVDSQNAAHISYTPGYLNLAPPGQAFGRAYSQLAYATNKGGSWGAQIVYQPPGDSGDAGLGSSIAIGPGDIPSIASYFTLRAPTGSAATGQLLFHTRTQAGGWVSQVVANSSAGYALSDGPQYTGVGPQLHFNPAGVPEIVFSDLAAEHVNGSQRVRVGQLRHAVFQGNGWGLETIVSQSVPLAQQLAYPSFAFSAAGFAYAGLTETNLGGGPFLAYVTAINDVGSRLAVRIPAVAQFFAHSAENYSNVVTSAYQNYLHRATDAGGVAYWVGRLQNGLTDEQLEAALLASPEYIDANGGNNGVAGQGWVVGMYRDLLGRNADPGGLNYWTGQLNSGARPFDIAYGFAASQEREAARIDATYRLYLDRGVDQAGLNFWLSQFAQGVTNETLTGNFVGSQEYYYNHGLGNLGAWIQALYRDILHRTASDADIQNWINYLTA